MLRVLLLQVVLLHLYISSGMSALSAVAAFFLLVAAALALTAAFTTEWYYLRLAVGPFASETTLGLFRVCNDGDCESLDATAPATCDRSADEWKRRMYASFGLAIAAGVWALAGCVCSAVTVIASGQSPTRPLSVLFAILAAACMGSSLALFVYTNENWFFCDKEPCTYFEETVPSATCEAKYRWSFYLGIGATACALLAFVLQLVAVVTAKADEPTDDTAKPANPAGADQSESYYAAEPYEENAVAPPEGDWVYDEASGLYWSDTEYLYLDTLTNQYFDPKSSQWYDPASQTWYVKE